MRRKNRIKGIEVGSRCLVQRDDRMLFQYDAKYNYYRFPGGHTEFYESITHCAIREMREELGVDAVPKRIVYINENMYMIKNRLRHEIVFYFDCGIMGEPIPLEEKVKVVWADPQEVLDKFRPRILLERIIRDMRDGFPKVYYILTYGNRVKLIEKLSEGSLPVLLYNMPSNEEFMYKTEEEKARTSQ
ncbi:MAG: NUDIX domain-containing protein [Desulfurococcales archaeon]|nr:NUDIX domain-containing protein [Desulfurococcales archaeon]